MKANNPKGAIVLAPTALAAALSAATGRPAIFKATPVVTLNVRR